MKIIVTGGYGFIGSTLIKKLIIKKKIELLNIDGKKYASMPESLNSIKKNRNYSFIKLDISNFDKLLKVIFQFKPDIIFNLAAESHVDQSIKSPKKFIDSNICGTFNLLEVIREYLKKNRKKRKTFKFIHISTDEVYGSLKKGEKSFKEISKFLPNSPYSSSKASSDLLVRSWNKTYKLPTIITNCSNNFGPWQFPEKLIPVIIYSCLHFRKIPIYGNGKNIREWIFVEDHVDALISIMKKGKIGETYNIGSGKEFSNLELVKKICHYFNNNYPSSKSYLTLLSFVKDRVGHDFRYSINSNKLKKEISFSPKHKFNESLKQTIEWYILNQKWLENKIKVIKSL